MEFDWSSVIRPSGISISFEQLRLFEAELGCTLPEDYRAFLLRFNGGQIVVDHSINVPELTCAVCVRTVLALTKANPWLGVIEARDVQSRHRLCLRQSLEIADDGGPGLFYLLLEGSQRGAVYFVYKDGRPMLEGDWYSSTVRIPDCMVRISQSFDSLGQAICGARGSQL
jgi:hypothetical protein